MGRRWGSRSASSTESFLSTFGFVYTFLALYVITNVLLFLAAAVEETRRHEDFEKYVTAIARGSGATLNFNMAVVILVASRSALGLLRQTPLAMVLPIDKAMPEFHRVVGMLVVFAGAAHSVAHWVRYGIKKPWAGGFKGQTSLFISGMVLLVVLITIRVVARPVVYRANYELFYRAHVGGSIIAFITIIMHGLHYGVPNTWKWVVAPLVMYSLDIVLRFYREKRSYLLVSKHSAVFQGPDILKIRLPRVFHFQAGQYAELKVPELSHFQWHPFTIASAPHESEMTFYVKAVGNWTMSLYQLFSERLNSEGNDIEVHIRGPFGAPAQHVGQFDRILLIGGGVGATPFCSVVKDAYNWISNWTPRYKRAVHGRPKEQWNSSSFEKKSGRRQKHRSSSGRSSSKQGRRVHGSKKPTERRANSNPERDFSQTFTTNVFTEHLDSADLERELHHHWNNEPPPMPTQTSSRRDFSETLNMEPREQSTMTNREMSLYTAKDYLSSAPTPDTGSPSRSKHVNTSRQYADKVRLQLLGSRGLDDSQAAARLKAGGSISKKSRRMRTSHGASGRRMQKDDDEMGSYRDMSFGLSRASFDYFDALHSAYVEQGADEVYQKSLNMIVGMSFGSASLVRTMQMKRRERTRVGEAAERIPIPLATDDLKLFRDPKIMFLLFMRSVTVNMLLLWVLLLKYIMAGTAHVFGGLIIFGGGLELYKSPVLTGIDLLLAFIISLVVGIPSIIEILELGAAPVHGFDLFVLFPTAAFGVIVDVLTLLNLGGDIELFGVVRLFVLWPILGILMTVRLLREIGERTAQAENIAQTHSSTREVDFYWTAPTPADDRWLVDELTPFSDLNTVRMHRHLTRCTGPPPEGESVDHLARYLYTNYGRPNWTEILNETAEKSKNNTTIGVFFCGPHTMGAQVQAACLGAMRNSIVRGLQSGARAMRGLEEVFGEAISANEYTGDTGTGKAQGSQGCNVRFVFKQESFA